MLKKKNYRPFNKNTHFFSFSTLIEIKKLHNWKSDYTLELKKNGYIPKTGIFVSENMPSRVFKKSDVLDIGTGETGILAIHAASLGAKKVIGIDINGNAILWARHNANINNYGQKVKFRKVNIEKYNPKCKFDIILSNPPQMPVEKNKSFHDDGDHDGRKCILTILKFTNKYLKRKGFLFLTSFEFLGADQSYNDDDSLFCYARKYNLKVSIIAGETKAIKPGSYTEKNLYWIHKIYPYFKFKKNRNGQSVYQIYLLKIEKL